MRYAPIVALTMLAGLGVASAADLSTAPGRTRYEFGWRVVEVDEAAPEALTAEPVYVGKPTYFALRFGNGPDALITAAIDDSEPGAPGYETLYVDANNNGDLTDDPVLKPELTQDGFATVYTVPPFELTVRYADAPPRRFAASLEIFANHRREQGTWWSVGCQLSDHVEGRIDIGGHTNMLVAVYDSTYSDVVSNGCFDDYCTDRIRLDLDGDGMLSPASEDFPLSRVLLLDGRLWDLSVDSAGRQLLIEPSTRTTGRVQFGIKARRDRGVAAGTVEVVSPPLGYAFTCPIGESRDVSLPEAEYTVSRATVALPDSKGVDWEAVFAVPTPFQVLASRKSSVGINTFGAPFKLEPRIRGRLQVGRNVCIWPYLAGVGNELYQNISPAKSRMIPRLRIVDPNGIEVLNATMEYG